MTEIGSYFEYDHSLDSEKNKDIDWLPHGISDYTYTFSGRSAIELALVNIMRTKEIKRVYMPSYCCTSMIGPFKKYNIELLFYDVQFNGSRIDYDINESLDYDLFFAMSYFGVEQSMDNIIEKMSKKNIIVMEDITHRLLSNKTNSIYSDYLIASLRKWFPIPAGGLLMSQHNQLIVKPTTDSNKYVVEQTEAMKLKTRFLNGNHTIEKEIFFNKFKYLNHNIQGIDYTFKIDKTSEKLLHKLNVNEIIEKRRQNALSLYNYIKDLQLIKPLIKDVNLDIMTPLFVPIMVTDKRTRNKLIRFLIDEQIFCPVHWPVPEEVTLNSGNELLYNSEISIICDQRYTKKDMTKIIEKMGEFEQQYV